MRLRHVGIFIGLSLLTVTAAIHARQATPKTRDANADKRLQLARQGYDTAVKRISSGVGEAESDRLPLWSLRIMEAQRDATGDAVDAAREHLERMKGYVEREEAAYKAAQSPISDVLNGQYILLEAESILAKAQAR